jgi:long-chain fatty acid transport protein
MRTALLVLTASLLFGPDVAHGQGFGIYEQGARAMSLAGAGVAEPCEDGSAIYLNPAAPADRKGTLVGLGGNLIFGSGTFSSDHGDAWAPYNRVASAPQVYFQHGINDKLG